MSKSADYESLTAMTVYMNGETEMDEEHMILAVHCVSLITIALLIATKMFSLHVVLALPVEMFTAFHQINTE